jgi:hypothetical protein
MMFSTIAWPVARALGVHTVEVWIYDDALRGEQAERLIVLYLCLYDPTPRCITTVDAQGRQQYRHVPTWQLALLMLELLRVV